LCCTQDYYAHQPTVLCGYTHALAIPHTILYDRKNPHSNCQNFNSRIISVCFTQNIEQIQNFLSEVTLDFPILWNDNQRSHGIVWLQGLRRTDGRAGVLKLVMLQSIEAAMDSMS
jgi:hypothetical protein